MSLILTTTLLGVVLATCILVLVRRGHLHGSQAAWWLAGGGLALLLGANPTWIDRIGQAVGVAYPPMLLVVISILAILVKLLQADIELARKERRLRRLTQKMAMLEFEMRQLRGQEPESGADSARPADAERRKATSPRRAAR